MTVKFWQSYTKKKNSTHQPIGTSVDFDNVRLKEGTSFLSPTLIMDGTAVSTATEAYFNGKYYFVKDVRSVPGGQWEVDLEMDVLASHKTSIGNYTGLITRTADAAWFNPCIRDELNPPTDELSFSYSSTSDLTYLFSEQASQTVQTFYILNVMGDASQPTVRNPNGLVRTYLLYPAEMTQLAIQLNSSDVWQTIKNNLGNPMDAIVSCHLMTFDAQASVISGAIERIKLGGVDTGKDAKAIGNRYYKSSVFGISLPSAWFSPYDTYADAAPYVTLTLYLPYVGVVPLDYSMIQDTRTIYYQLIVDFVTGDIEYVLMKTQGGGIVATYEGNMATKCPVSSKAFNALQRVGGAVTAIGGLAVSAFTGGAGAVAGLGTAAAGAGQVINSLDVHTQLNGNVSSNMGSQMSLGVRINAYVRKPAHGLTDEYATCGLPCMKVGKPSDHPGFCKFQEASVPIADFDSVRDRVNDFMISGFYYE